MQDGSWPILAHAERRTIVLPRRRILFVPMPKSGCTSMLWALSRVAGQSAEQFHRSVSTQITPAMTIHDLDRWRDRFKWAELDLAERDAIAANPAWLRYTIVRDPAPRLWSAWQSKLLMREPDYVGSFGTRSWFPRRPDDAKAVIDAFRTFVHALDTPDTRPIDAHWAPQSRILAIAPPLTHVGHVESLPATLEVLHAQIGGRAADRVRIERENTGQLPYTPAVYDAEAARIVNRVYADDVDRFGYRPLDPDTSGSALDDWRAAIEPLLPLVRSLIDRHERIGALQRVARRQRAGRTSADTAPPSTDATDEGAVPTHAVDNE